MRERPNGCYIHEEILMTRFEAERIQNNRCHLKNTDILSLSIPKLLAELSNKLVIALFADVI